MTRAACFDYELANLNNKKTEENLLKRVKKTLGLTLGNIGDATSSVV
jgi:hypothetical protein